MMFKYTLKRTKHPLESFFFEGMIGRHTLKLIVISNLLILLLFSFPSFAGDFTDEEIKTILSKLDRLEQLESENIKLKGIITKQDEIIEIQKNQRERLEKIIQFDSEIEQKQKEYIDFLEKRLDKEERREALKSLSAKIGWAIALVLIGMSL